MKPMDWLAVLAGWQGGEGPLHDQLRRALASAIDRAEVAPGQRLPPERTLARRLGISRTTVVAAFAALRREGRIASRQGSGTWVERQTLHEGPSTQERKMAGAFRRNNVFRSMLRESTTAIEFLGAHLAAPAVLPGLLAEVAAQEGPRFCRGHGYSPLGLPDLRQAIAEHLTREGLPSTAEQVLVTNGAQQAVALVASLFVERGDGVIVEDPTYLGGIDLLTAAGARLVPVPTGIDGPDLGRLRDAVTRGARLVYLIPTFHNPTGTVTSEPVRRAIARLSEETRIPVVEDMALADLHLGPPPPRPIAAFSREAPVLTVGSLSKLVWGGLRVGWVRGNEALVERLGRFKAVADLGGPVLSQAIAARLLPMAREIRELRRDELTRKLGGLTAALSRHLPGWTYHTPGGGLLLWTRLPHGDAAELAVFAERHGVAIVPGAINSPEGRFADHVRLPFIHDAATLEEGVTRLGAAWREYEDSARSRSRNPGILV